VLVSGQAYDWVMSSDPNEYRTERSHEVQERIVQAIAQILAEERNEMTTKVIVLAEVINDQGQRAVWTCTSPGMAMWDESGLLTFALDKTRNFELLSRLAEVGREDEDDE